MIAYQAEELNDQLQEELRALEDELDTAESRLHTLQGV